jgi:hypothetical protein
MTLLEHKISSAVHQLHIVKPTKSYDDHPCLKVFSASFTGLLSNECNGNQSGFIFQKYYHDPDFS